MSEKLEELDLLKLFTDRQDAEARLHWSRNSYFLVVMSILILAFSQKPVENIFQLVIFQMLIAILGIILSITWLLIQYRSSQYMLYYKREAQRLAKIANAPDVYPEKLGGIEIRKLAYILPIAFSIIWSALLFLVAMNLFSLL
ncbi:MAG: hypothetical protein QXG39_07190 [Candidatus Aenigmatarchaeota archaeon]